MSESNENQNNPEDNDHANFPAAVTIQAKSSDHSQSVFDEVEDSNCEEETDWDVNIPTVANTEEPTLSVKVYTKPSPDLATVSTKFPTQPKINFPS